MSNRERLKTAVIQRANGLKGNSTPSVELLRPTLREIRDTRAMLHEQLEQAAHNGVIPDALALSLYANHLAEAEEMGHQLVQAEQDYQAGLARLNAMFPPALPPVPAPPAPRPGQFYPRLGTLLGQKKARVLH